MSSRTGCSSALFQTFMFHTVVQWGLSDVARSIIFILETIYRCFNCEKKIQNRLTFDEVITKIRHLIFWDTVYTAYIWNLHKHYERSSLKCYQSNNNFVIAKVKHFLQNRAVLQCTDIRRSSGSEVVCNWLVMIADSQSVLILRWLITMYDNAHYQFNMIPSLTCDDLFSLFRYPDDDVTCTSCLVSQI